MKIFADTSFFVALYNKADTRHKESKKTLHLLEAEKPRIVTSNYVYVETTTLLLTTHPYHGYFRAMLFDKDIRSNIFCELIMTTTDLFTKAREIFYKYNRDKQWSFTDCASFALMKDLGIKDVLTFDHHFAEMGFSIVK